MQSRKRSAKPGEARAFAEKALTHTGDECLLWPFGANKLGYGRLWFKKTVMSASTAVCEMAHGPKPVDKDVAAHKCGNKLCVNPGHLYWATNSENQGRDRLRHGTDNRGTKNGQSKLTPEQIIDIKSRERGSRKHARELGISWPTYLRIRNGQRWGWLNVEG